MSAWHQQCHKILFQIWSVTQNNLSFSFEFRTELLKLNYLFFTSCFLQTQTVLELAGVLCLQENPGELERSVEAFRKVTSQRNWWKGMEYEKTRPSLWPRTFMIEAQRALITVNLCQIIGKRRRKQWFWVWHLSIHTLTMSDSHLNCCTTLAWIHGHRVVFVALGLHFLIRSSCPSRLWCHSCQTESRKRNSVFSSLYYR